MLDPSEDIFTNTLCLDDGEYTIFEGIWEGAGFYTQLAVQAISFPRSSDEISSLRKSITALLKLSSEIVRRRMLSRYEYGASEPIRQISLKDAEWGRRNRRSVSFTLQELKTLEVELEDLAAFGFLPDYKSKLVDSVVGNSPLDRYPLGYHNEEVVVLAPTAISSAIRYFVIEFFQANNALEHGSGLLAYAYRDLLDRIGIFGASNRPDLEFEKTDKGFFSSVVKEVDLGRWLNIVFVVDAFDGFEEGGLVEPANDPHRFDKEINASIDHAYKIAAKSPNFREMITLTVGCGLGRAISHAITAKNREKWRQCSLSAYDLVVISQIDQPDPLLIWQLLDAQDAVHRNGVRLQNINGLINLLAWSQSLDGHLVPHESMPDDFFGDNTFLVIDQNSQKQLRYDVAVKTDRRLLTSPYGEQLEMRKISDEQFPTERHLPLYGYEGFLDGRGIPLAYVMSAGQVWWGEVNTPTAERRDHAYARWQLLKTWLPRLADILTRHLPEARLSFLLHLTFNGNVGDSGGYDAPGTYDASLDAISISTDADKNAVFLEIGEGFEHGVFNAENVAERALMVRAIQGFFRLCNEPLPEDLLEEIVSGVVPNSDARQTHRYASMEIRDLLRSRLPRKLIKTSRIDEGALKLGLGWRFRDRSEGALIEGVEPCTQFLNKVTRELTNDLRAEIGKYSKDALLRLCLTNHEIAAVDRQQWRRTSRAILALRDQSPDARNVIINNEFELNGIFASCRNVAEMAVCDALDEGGLLPGKLDFARMLSRAMLIFHLGNNSNCMRWGAMEPTIKITPQGDIHANHDFSDQVIQPYAHAGTSSSIDEDIKRYPERIFDGQRPKKQQARSIDLEFEAAFLAEMGGSIEEYKILIESIEDRAFVQQSPIITERLSELSQVSTDIGKLAPEVARRIIQRMMLVPRQTWDTIPNGCLDKDIRFWRFRRQLSIVRRPFLALSEQSDPVVMVAPGMLRDSFAYLVSNYYSASFPLEQIESVEMRRYKSHTDDIRGSEFEIKVQEKFDLLGWSTYRGKTLSEILGANLDRDYGDIDVLAISPGRDRILVIECKDLLERKTPGEIAEQISKFQGVSANGKRDLLRKHLDRLEKLQAESGAVKTFCNAERDAEIEGWLVFSNIVPMQWAWGELQSKSKIVVFDDIARIFQ
ncbi:hypothetical protein HJA_05777 [Hyphomonas jannaschiana VP2]|uniref:Uncharacterized protein n=2 Tax=Hyphomonas jannaschiana TaxID=86 RepID=A0A059FGS2_9PROT|nr:hypothetical protein HJA_05777 [Hyphomonas jannaschiana VP2]